MCQITASLPGWYTGGVVALAHRQPKRWSLGVALRVGRQRDHPPAGRCVLSEQLSNDWCEKKRAARRDRDGIAREADDRNVVDTPGPHRLARLHSHARHEPSTPEQFHCVGNVVGAAGADAPGGNNEVHFGQDCFDGRVDGISGIGQIAPVHNVAAASFHSGLDHRSVRITNLMWTGRDAVIDEFIAAGEDGNSRSAVDLYSRDADAYDAAAKKLEDVTAATDTAEARWIELEAAREALAEAAGT